MSCLFANYCVVFLLCFSSPCVTYISSFSGLSICFIALQFSLTFILNISKINRLYE